MASKILLINVNQCETPYPVFPLGLSHIAAALRGNGHETLMLDMNRDRETLAEQLADFAPTLVGLSLRNIDDVDIETRRFFVPDLVDTVALIKKLTRVPVVVGGSAFSLFPAEILRMSKADYGIQGEGENAMCALAAALEENTSTSDIPGLVYVSDEGPVANAAQSCTMADIPVAFKPAEMVEYYKQHSSMLNIQTQRGCAFRCVYCTYPLIEGTRFRFRDPKEVVDEFEAGTHLGIHYFFVVDSVFNTKREHVVGVCEELIRRGLDINWCCFLRPTGLDAELMALMSRAGLTHIEYGADSFCDSVLEAYGKDFTFEDIYTASELARAQDIHYAHFLIAGGPTETEATLREGFENSRRLRKTVIFPFIGMRLYPGTRLYQAALKEGVVEESTDLLEPFYYVTPSMDEHRIRELLNEFADKAKNWVVGELPPEMARVAKMLRDKGVEGPLWEFLVR